MNGLVIKTEQNIGIIIGTSRIDDKEIRILNENDILTNFKTLSEFKNFINNPNNEIILTANEPYDLDKMYKILQRREKINKIYVE